MLDFVGIEDGEADGELEAVLLGIIVEIGKLVGADVLDFVGIEDGEADGELVLVFVEIEDGEPEGKKALVGKAEGKTLFVGSALV